MSEAQPNPDTDKSAKKAAGNPSKRWGLKSPDELIGTRIDGRYTIVERIATGGMGAVFKAIQAPMGRVCAVKVLSATYDGKKDPAFDKRFRRGSGNDFSTGASVNRDTLRIRQRG